jgi:transposase
MTRTKQDAAPDPEPKASAAQFIKTARRATRKKYSAEDKIRVVMEGIRGDQPVASLCRQEGISANQYYSWLKEFMEAGKTRLKGEETRGATKGEVEGLRRENVELRQMVAELLLEVRALKKSLF